MNAIPHLQKLRPKREPCVVRELGILYIKRLNHPVAVWDFIMAVREGRVAGFEEFIVNLSKLEEFTYFPNVLTPIAAFISNAKNEAGLKFKLSSGTKMIRNTNFMNPQSSGMTKQYPNILDKVWKFDAPEDVFKLVTEYMDEIYKADVFEGANVLRWIEWCLNEVMDNVIQHAETTNGFVMGQIHPHNKHIAFCVADAGRGVFQSLQTSSDYWPKDPVDALTLALQEGVTRDKKIGQGNGLWGLREVVHKSSGKLTLASSGNSIDSSVVGDISIHQYPWLNDNRGGTVVDFQLDYSQPISLTDILGGYQPESVKIFKATDEEGQTIKYKLIKQKSGFGTRKSGERIRNEILNLILESGKRVEIDFKGVGVVSSSFADELVAKIYIELTPIRFNQIVQLSNMNEDIVAIVNKAIEQRMRLDLSE